MGDNETQIRALIGRSAEAVHAGDIDGVLTEEDRSTLEVVVIEAS